MSMMRSVGLCTLTSFALLGSISLFNSISQFQIAHAFYSFPVIAGGLVAGRDFVSRHGRTPTKRENWTFSLKAFVVGMLVLMAALIALEPHHIHALQRLDPTSFYLPRFEDWFVPFCALYIGLLLFSFGPLTRELTPSGTQQNVPPSEAG
ncbi:MAG: ABZJ_00895 family protein [Pseudomonadota bacterium]